MVTAPPAFGDRCAAGPGDREARSGTTMMLVSLAAAGLVFAMLQSLVAPALPVIAGQLGVSTADVSWVVTAYLLAASVATPIAGRLGDMFGRRRVLLIVLGLLAAGSVVAGLAADLGLLILGRVLQGAGGAVLPLAFGIVRDELPPRRVGVTVGVLSALLGAGGGLGAVLAGPIVDLLSWNALFWLPLVLILLAAAGIATTVPESRTRAPGPVDVVGALVLSVALVCVLLAFSKGAVWGWTSAATLGLLTGGALALALWVRVELWVGAPLVDLRIIGARGVWTTNMAGLAFGVGTFGSFLLVPQLLQIPAGTGYGFGMTVGEAGLYLLPATIAMVVFAPLSGILDRRFGARLPLVAGAVATTASFAMLAVAHHDATAVLVAVTVTGVGLGLSSAAMTNAILAHVPPAHSGMATSINTLMRTVGGSVGTAVLASVLTATATVTNLPSEAGFTIAFWICTATLGVAVACALLLPGRRPAGPGETEAGTTRARTG